MSILLGILLPIVKPAAAWLVGVLTRELVSWTKTFVEKTIRNWKGDKAATTEQSVLNNPNSTEQEKQDAEKNLLNS